MKLTWQFVFLHGICGQRVTTQLQTKLAPGYKPLVKAACAPIYLFSILGILVSLHWILLSGWYNTCSLLAPSFYQQAYLNIHHTNEICMLPVCQTNLDFFCTESVGSLTYMFTHISSFLCPYSFWPQTDAIHYLRYSCVVTWVCCSLFLICSTVVELTTFPATLITETKPAKNPCRGVPTYLSSILNILLFSPLNCT